MKNFIGAVVVLTVLTFSGIAEARGGYSSRSSFSSSRGSFSRSYSRPSYRGYSTSRPTGVVRSSGSTFQQSPRAVTRSTPTVTRQTTVTRTRTASGGYVGGGVPYGGFGYGHPYYGTNGFLTGLIIGNMLHPSGTVVYQGGGYSGSALQYPDGRIVNQQGQQVGTYTNGQFVPMDNGPIVAQQAPQDAVTVAKTEDNQDEGWAWYEIVGLMACAGAISIIGYKAVKGV